MSDLEQLIRQIVRDELARAQPSNEDAPTHLTVDEYAKRWSLSPSTVRQAIRDGRLACSRVGRAVRISADARIGAVASTANQRAALALMRGGKVR